VSAVAGIDHHERAARVERTFDGRQADLAASRRQFDAHGIRATSPGCSEYTIGRHHRKENDDRRQSDEQELQRPRHYGKCLGSSRFQRNGLTPPKSTRMPRMTTLQQ
jgi:hypothetical protein